MGQWLRRKRQKRAARRAVKQAKDLQDIYAQAGMTPDEVNAINSQVANIGGATKQQGNAAAQTGGDTGDAACAYMAPEMGYDQTGNDPFNDDSNNPDSFFEQVERMRIDPVYAMVRYNKMVGKGSEGGKNYSQAWEEPQYFENYDGGGLASVIGGDIDAIMGQFARNWEDNKPANFNEKENLFGLNKFFKNLGHKKDEDGNDNLESLEIGETIMEYLPVLIMAYVGYHFYGYTGAIVAGIAGYFVFHKHEDNPAESAAKGKK